MSKIYYSLFDRVLHRRALWAFAKVRHHEEPKLPETTGKRQLVFGELDAHSIAC